MFHQYLDAEMLRTWCVHMVSMMCFMLFLGSSVCRCCLFVLFECCTFTSFVCPPYLCENHLVDIYDIEFIPFYSYDYLLLNLVFYLDYIYIHGCGPLISRSACGRAALIFFIEIFLS